MQIMINYKTPSGKTVKIANVMERENIGDHNSTHAVDEIDVWVDDDRKIATDTVVEHPQYGTVIDCGHQGRGTREYVYIAPERVDEVKKLYADRRARWISEIKSDVVVPVKRGFGWCNRCSSYCYGDCTAGGKP